MRKDFTIDLIKNKKRALGAVVPSGAGESGWLGGRKPPLPSRGVVSLQIKFRRFQAEKKFNCFFA